VEKKKRKGAAMEPEVSRHTFSKHLLQNPCFLLGDLLFLRNELYIFMGKEKPFNTVNGVWREYIYCSLGQLLLSRQANGVD
jgi:hypothetical protein